MSILLSCLVAPLVLFCLAGPSIAAGEQTEAMFYEEIKKALEERPLYFVAYERGERGQPVAIIASPGADVFEDGTGKDGVNINKIETLVGVLKRIQEKRSENFVDTTCETSFYVHGSPGCRIKKIASGGYKVICD